MSSSPFPRSAENSCHSSNSCSKKSRVQSPFSRSAEHSSYSCSKEKSRVQRKNLVFMSLSRASVEHSCHSSYSCSKSLLAQRRKFVSFELFVFKVPFPRSVEHSCHSSYSCSTRKISCSPFPRSVEHSCHSSYSCSQEKSRVHKKIIRVPIRMQK